VIAETLISGEWLTGLIVAVTGAIGSALVAYKKGAASRQDVSLQSPVPEVPTRKVSYPPSWDAHRALCDRVGLVETEVVKCRDNFEAQLREIRREQSEQFIKLMQAGETRKDMIFDKIESMARGFHHRVDQLMGTKRSLKS